MEFIAEKEKISILTNFSEKRIYLIGVCDLEFVCVAKENVLQKNSNSTFTHIFKIVVIHLAPVVQRLGSFIQ